MAWMVWNVGSAGAFSPTTWSSSPQNWLSVTAQENQKHEVVKVFGWKLVKPPELTDSLITKAEDGLSEEGAHYARIVPPESILVSCIGNLGKIGINKIPVAFNQQINAIVLPKEVLPKYSFYYFQTSGIKSWLNDIASATTIPIVNKSKFETAPIVLAPLPEQHRIVAKIEELFSDLDAGVAALRKTQAELKRYRQAVLKAAVEGKLTVEWRAANAGKVESAEKLLERIRAERAKSGKGAEAHGSKGEINAAELPALPEGWAWEKLGAVFDVALGGTPSRSKEEYWNGDIAWVSSGEVSFNRIKTTRESITAEGLANSNAKILPIGTVLLAMIGEGKTRGQPAILDISATTNQNIAAVLCSQTPISSNWVFYWLASRYAESRKSSSGGMQYALNAARIRDFDCPLPPLAEQQQIVAEVERRLSVAEQVEKTVEQSLKQAERLRASILRQAFAGKLVPQDPGDESAERLLERIRAEREKQTSKLKTPKLQK